MAVALPNLGSAAGLKKLDQYLLARSYITGYQAFRDDITVYSAPASSSSAEYANVSRWYNSSFLNRLQRQGQRRKQVWDFSGASLSHHRLFAYSPHHRLYHTLHQIPFVLPYIASLPLVQKCLPLIPIPSTSIIASRDFCSLTEGELTSDGEDDGVDEGTNDAVGLDSAEVDKVCKVIDELFALDRNMEAVLDEVGVNLSHDLVVAVLERFRHARKPAFRFFCWAGQRPGFTHDSRTYNAMMTVLAKTRQFQTMVSLLEEMGEKKVLNMETFMIAMKGFATAKERRKAVSMFELMKKYKYKVGAETINTLLDCLGKAKLGKEAQALFVKLEGRFTPNLKTYSVLLNGWCRVKNLKEAGEIWNEMIEKGFMPDIVAHNTMLEGLLKTKKWSDAIKLFEVMKAKGPAPDVRSFSILIRDLCKQGKMVEAVEYFDEMVHRGCQPDAAVYTCLITGFGNQKRMDKVYDLLKEMKDKGCPPDGRTYNALIKLLTSRMMPDDAVTTYKKMVQSGIEPSIHTYNMIMKSFFQIRNFDMGYAVWDEMTRKGFCPDDNSYTVFIGGLIREGRGREACKYLEEMIEKGMKVPQLDYNKFAADFSRAGKPNILDELAQKMKFCGKFEISNVFARWADMMKKRVKRRDPRNCNQYAEGQE